jgi:hypothetical protein
MRALLAVLLFGLLAVPARSETVFVDASFSEIGNGWLFGSRRDQSCWLALPWHVIAAMDARTAPPFAFTNQRGQVGETAEPIRVSQNAAALEAAGGNDDLAFARVTAGFAPEGCVSRLGLPGAGFAQALDSSARMHFSAMQERTTIGFQGELLRATTDADRGSTFLVRPANDSDRAFLQGGLSGGIVLMEWQGRLHPAGMVLSVLENQSAAVALRFDKLRQAFEAVEAGADTPLGPELDEIAKIDVIGVRGIIGGGSDLLSTITNTGGEGCWRAAPAAGARAVEITLAVTDLVPGKRYALHLVADPVCGPPESFVIERREASGGWTTVSGACPSGPEGTGPCRLPPLRSMELRLRVAPGQAGWVGLSRIVLR